MNQLNSAPIPSDGKSSAYYDIELPEWLFHVLHDRFESGEQCYIKTEELIEVVFGNDFAFGTLFKSLVRARGAVLGRGKKGNTLQYELNKVRYYTDRIEEMEARK